VPEGDTIAWAAGRIRPVLEGRVPDEILTPQSRHTLDRWPQRLAGRPVERLTTHGKHLFIRFGPPAVPAGQGRADRMSSGYFSGELVLHSHLRMTGAWSVARERRRCAPRFLWRAVGHLSDEEAVGIVEALRPRMLRSARLGPREIAPRVYALAGRPCPRCGTRIAARGQGDEHRTTYWCPGCQA